MAAWWYSGSSVALLLSWAWRLWVVALHMLAVGVFVVAYRYSLLPPPREAHDVQCVSSSTPPVAAEVEETRSPICLDTLRLVLDSGAPHSIHVEAAHMRNLRPCNESYRRAMRATAARPRRVRSANALATASSPCLSARGTL